MKRKLSFLIAAIMVLSLLPAMSVSAASENTILAGGGTAKKDFTWAGATTSMPVLQISKKTPLATWANGYSFNLNVTNAKWTLKDYFDVDGMYDGGTGDPDGLALPDGTLLDSTGVVVGSANVGNVLGDLTSGIAYSPVANTAAGTRANTAYVVQGSKFIFGTYGDSAEAANMAFSMTQIGDRRVQVTITNIDTRATAAADLFIPLMVELTGEGDARVEISGATGAMVLTTGSYAFARGAGGATNTYIEKDDKTFSNWVDLDPIIIEETRVASIDPSKSNGMIKLTLPAGFKWVNDTPEVELFSGFDPLESSAGGGANAVTTGFAKAGADDAVLDIAIGAHDPGTANNNRAGAIAQSGSGGNTADRAGTIKISDLRVQRTDSIAKTKTGPVNVKVTVPGGTAQTIQVAVFAGRNVSLIIEDAELPEIVNGKWKDDAKDDTTLCLLATVEESALNTWNEKADTILKLNKGVHFRAVEVDDSSGFVDTGSGWGDVELTDTDDETVWDSGVEATSNLGLAPETLTIRPIATGAAGIDGRKGDETLSLTLKIWVTVEPGFTGDITLSTDEDNESFGAQLTEPIAKAINPFEITTSSTPIDLGYMNMKVADIIIKENVAGAFDVEGSDNVFTGGTAESPQLYRFRVAGYNWLDDNLFKSAGQAEVVEGDLLLEPDGYGVTDGFLDLEVKRASDEPSTVKLSGITIDTTRWIAEGKLSLEMGGYACANWRDDLKDSAGFTKEWVPVSEDYVNVITAAPNKGTKVTTVVAVTIGADKLTADGKEFPVDVPAFLETWTDGNGYTMVPVRAVAEALGSSNFQINWGETTKTVTIRDTGSGVVSQFTVGSNKVVVNGAPIEFSGPSCMIKDGRSFLPFRALGESVLNVPVYWDPETRTAWFNRYDAAAPTTSAAAE